MRYDLDLPDDLWSRMVAVQEVAQVDWGTVVLAALERRCSTIEAQHSVNVRRDQAGAERVGLITRTLKERQ